jgi:uncharacterized protein YhjY with autotransporter beta-barrel domain
MRNDAVRIAVGSVASFAALVGSAAPAVAAVTANDASYTFPIGIPDSTVNISFNVTENDNGLALPLVSGAPRPLQLLEASSTNQSVMVSRFRNCITVSFVAPGPTTFEVVYAMSDGMNPGTPGVDGGTITFTASSTASYMPPKDPNCGDANFSAATPNDDTATTVANQPTLIQVLANDGAPLNHHVILAPGVRDQDVFQLTTNNGGTVLARADDQIEYIPAPGFTGTDTFSYILEEYGAPGFEGLNRSALVTVTVLPSGTSPTTPTTPSQPNPVPPDPNAPPGEVSDGQILVNGGTGTVIADSDSKPGETVTFTAARADSTEPPNLVNVAWFVGKETEPRQTGPSLQFTVALPDGQTDLRAVGTDIEGFSGMKSISVTIAPPPPMLSELPNLQPNQMGVAAALDRMCGDDTSTEVPESLTEDQRDALARCNAIANADMASQMQALEELSAKDFNGTRTQTLLFTKSTYSGVSDRLGALRGGARGVSLRGVNLIIDGKSIPLAEVQRMAGKLFGGGASADADEDDDLGSLLGDRWGLWTRGNLTFGKKSASDADNGFKADQFSLVGGLDYRLSHNTAIGGALSYGSSKVSYSPIGQGGLDTKSWAFALYGTSYVFKRGYVDGVVNVANSTYGSERRIRYNDSLASIDRSAKGNTDGFTWSGGLSGGYDFSFKALTISPSGSVFYTDSGINGFRENGAGGLDLAYADQSFQSVTATLGMRINYAWKLPFGILMPYVRSDYVRELDSNVAIFNVRFVNDMDSDAAPIAVQSDTPDQSYWRLSGGLSAQLPLGFAGYVEYQRLESLEFVAFQDLAVGLRMQYRF